MSGLGSALQLDSGNALFRVVGGASDEDKRRASFILSVMGELGTAAMAVGVRDLGAGDAFLLQEAAKAKVPLISTNLERDGKPVFPRSMVLERDGVKVALLAVSGTGAIPGVPGLIGAAPLPAVKAELAKLPPRDVTVLLAAGGYAEAMELAQALPGVELVLQSGEFRGTVPPQRLNDTYLLASGQRGQSVAKLELVFGQKRGAFADLNEAARDQELLANLDAQLGSIDERLSRAKDAEGKKALQALRKDMKARRDEQAKKVKTVSGGKTLKLDWLLLGPDVKDDAQLKSRVLSYEPTYEGQH